MDGEPVRGVEFKSVELPHEATTCTIRIEVAAARWVTDATRSADGDVKISDAGRSVIFTKPHAIERGTSVVVVEDFPKPRDVQVVGFDKNGRRRSVDSTLRGQPTKAFRVHDASLIGIKPEEIDRIELQSRPFEMVEFRDVPLAAPKR